jgi:hypothetical protein
MGIKSAAVTPQTIFDMLTIATSDNENLFTPQNPLPLGSPSKCSRTLFKERTQPDLPPLHIPPRLAEITSTCCLSRRSVHRHFPHVAPAGGPVMGHPPQKSRGALPTSCCSVLRSSHRLQDNLCGALTPLSLVVAILSLVGAMLTGK